MDIRNAVDYPGDADSKFHHRLDHLEHRASPSA
jgi:hypothetical protein